MLKTISLAKQLPWDEENENVKHCFDFSHKIKTMNLKK